LMQYTHRDVGREYMEHGVQLLLHRDDTHYVVSLPSQFDSGKGTEERRKEQERMPNDLTYELLDGNIFSAGVMRFRCLEVLFQFSFIGKESSIDRDTVATGGIQCMDDLCMGTDMQYTDLDIGTLSDIEIDMKYAEDQSACKFKILGET
jgi:Actin